MIYKLYLFAVGKCRFYVDSNIIQIINMLVRENINADNLHIEDGILVFDVPYFTKKNIVMLFKKHAFTYIKYDIFGIPLYILRYRYRFGLILGVILLIATVYISSDFVWKINVIGNEKVDDSTVLEGLSELGFEVGSYIPSVNVKLLASEYLMKNTDLSWMSINIVGNCVDIRVRETLSPENKEDSSKNLPSVIVAECDGYIERIELENGEIIKNTGSSVRKGETIISGVIEKEDGAFRLVRSAAKVYAKTSHTFTVSVPFTESRSIEIPLAHQRRSIIFFSKLFKIPFTSEIDRTDISHSRITTEYLTLPGDITLPLGIVTETFYETQSAEISLDAKQAEEKARLEIARIISEDFADAEIIAISKAPIDDDSCYTLEVTITCIEDIASERVITTEDYIKQ